MSDGIFYVRVRTVQLSLNRHLHPFMSPTVNLSMGFRDSLMDFDDILEGEITGRQAAIIIAIWMGAIALFGLISYIVVFVIMGF